MSTDIDIKALRQRLGWSQKRLAEHLGLSQPTVFRMETGSTKPAGPTRILLSDLAKANEEAAA